MQCHIGRTCMPHIYLIIAINYLKKFFVFCSFLLFVNKQLMLLSELMEAVSQTSSLDTLMI